MVRLIILGDVLFLVNLSVCLGSRKAQINDEHVRSFLESIWITCQLVVLMPMTELALVLMLMLQFVSSFYLSLPSLIFVTFFF